MSKERRFLKIGARSFLVIFGLFILNFVLRLPTFLKPFDMAYEAQSAFLGREAFVGNGFYATPWSFKPPGEVFTFGLSYLLFGFERWPVGVRVVSAILAWLASVFIYKLGRRLFGVWSGSAAALFFVVFFSRSDVFASTSAYVEMLMPFFTVLGFYLFFLSEKKNGKPLLFFAGLILGISLLYKQSAVYDFAPLFLYNLGETFFRLRKEKQSFKLILFANLPLVLGFALPMAIFTSYILLIGKFRLFFDWVVLKPIIYSRIRERHPLAYITKIFKETYPIVILASLGILNTLFRRSGERFLFIFWFLFTLLTFITSGKFWNYYFLQPFVPVCFLSGMFVGDVVSAKKRKFLGTAFLTLVFCLLVSLNKDYYQISFQRYLSFLKGETSKADYVLSLSEQNPWKMRRDAAEFLKENSKPEETLFVIEGTQGIYVLSDKEPIYRDFVFEQQFFENKMIGFAFGHFFETIESNRIKLLEKLRSEPPDFVVLVVEPPSNIFAKISDFPEFFSFVFTNYDLVKNAEDVWIYRLKKGEWEIEFPTGLVICPEFARNYFLVTPLSGGKVSLEPLAGEPQLFEATLAGENITNVSISALEVRFFGFDGSDLVGHALNRYSGTEDLHLEIFGVDKPVKMVRIRKGKTLWVYPINGINSIIRVSEDRGMVNLYFEPSPEFGEGEYEVLLVYQDDSMGKVKISADEVKGVSIAE